MSAPPPTWRSLLFTPADAPARLAKAHGRGADAIVVDLEDSVPTAGKDRARAALGPAVEALTARGQAVAVRINAGWRAAHLDLEVAVRSGVAAIVAPKVDRAADLAVLARMIGEWEAERGLAAGGIGLIALVESPAGLFAAPEIATVERVVGLALGSEDLSLAMGVAPTPQSLDLPCRMLALAAASRGLMALGLPLSIAAFRDADASRTAALAARAIGMTGALCVHPDQVALVNAAFAATPAEIAAASQVVAAWDRAGGAGPMELDGRMIDLPVVLRARRTLARAGAG